MAVAAFGERHGDGLIDALVIGRAVVERDRLVRPQAVDLRRDGQLVALVGHRVAGGDLAQRHAGGRLDVGPGQDHAAEGDQGILGREEQVQAGHQQHAGQQVAQADHLDAVDGRFHFDLGHLRGGGPFQAEIDPPLEIVADRLIPVAAEEEEIDQAVLQRGRLCSITWGGKDRIDAAQHQRDEPLPEEIVSQPGRQHEEQQRSPPESQAAGDQPLVGHRGQEQVGRAWRRSCRSGPRRSPPLSPAAASSGAAGRSVPRRDRPVLGRPRRYKGGNVPLAIAVSIASPARGGRAELRPTLPTGCCLHYKPGSAG